jgi:Anaphase-promoting complex sub unit 1 C-terminal domain
VDTGESVYVPVDVSAGLSSFPIRLTAPSLLLNSDTPWQEATVVSDKFYPIKLKLEMNKGCSFFVKRRTSLGGDGSLGVHLIGDGGSSSHGALDALTDSPFLLAYAEYIIPTRKKLPSNFEGDVLLDCIAEDTEESLPLYLTLLNSIQTMAKSGGSLASPNRHCGSCFPLCDLRLIRAYFENRQQNEQHEEPLSSLSAPRQSLMNPDLLAHLMHRAEIVTADRVAEDPRNIVWAIRLYGDDAEPEDVVMS